MWLHVPGPALASARELEDSTSQSSLPLTAAIALYVTSSEKAMRRPLSWHGWRKRHWLKLLSGTVSNPLTADLGAALWISSLRVSRANQLPLPVAAKDSTTNAGCGTTSLGSFATYDHQFCTWRTSHGSLLSATGEPLPVYSAPWPNSGSMRNGVSSQRRRWAPAIDVKDSSSWPTPTSHDGGANSQRQERTRTGGPDLQETASTWTTPNVMDAHIETAALGPSRIETNRTTDYLGRQVAMWQTPATDSFRSRGGDRKEEMGLDQQSRFWQAPKEEPMIDLSYQKPLPGETSNEYWERMTRYEKEHGITPEDLSHGVMWQTPQAADSQGKGREPRLKKGEKIRPDDSRDPETPGSYRSDLKDQAGLWQTPRNHERGDYTRDNGIKGRERLRLTGEAKMFPSPQARDWRDGRTNNINRSHTPDLNMAVETLLPQSNFPSSPLDQTTETGGAGLLKSRRRLNRLFVEWLMNWPIGWTSFDFAETEYSRWRAQSRSMFLLLVSE